MAAELRGKNGYVVGSVAYVKKLKEDFFLTKNPGDGIAKTLKHCNQYIQKSADEIYSDLDRNVAILSYIDKHDRDELIEFLEGLQDFYKISNGNGVSRINACISLLKLQDRRSRVKNPNDVDKAARLVRQGGRTKLSAHDRESLVAKAARNGAAYAAAGKTDNLSFLEAIGGLSDKDFYQFVMTRYDFINNPRKFYGSCGKPIASYAYMDVFEKRIFGSLDYFDGYNFGKDTLKGLEKIRDEIKGDVEKGIKTLNTYMEEANGLILNNALEDLKLCGIKNTDNCVKLCNDLIYYLGRKEEWVQELQELLNVMHYGTVDGRPLDEDGIFDNNTDLALSRYYKYILYGDLPQIKVTVNTDIGYATTGGENISKGYSEYLQDKKADSAKIAAAEKAYQIYQYGDRFIAMRGYYLSVHRLIAAYYLDTHDEDGKTGKLFWGEVGSVIGRYVGALFLSKAAKALEIGSVVKSVLITGGAITGGEFGDDYGREIGEIVFEGSVKLKELLKENPSLDLGEESHFN